MDNELIESAINKLASIVPDKISEKKLKEVIVDRVPKAFYYQMLMDVLTKEDKRSPEIILTEARLLVKLILFTVEKKQEVNIPRTLI